MVFGILVVFFRVKKRKKQLLVNKIKTLTTADEDIEMKVKQEQTTADQPPYTEMSTEAPPHVPNKSEYLMEYFNEKKTTSLTGGYSEIELEHDDSKTAFPVKLPRQVSLSHPMCEEMESSPTYQDVDQQ